MDTIPRRRNRTHHNKKRMPVKPELIATYTGIDLSSLEDEAAAKSAFDAAFVRRDAAENDKDLVGKIFGKTNHVLRNRVKSVAKTIGEEIDVKDVDPVDLLDTLNASAARRIEALTKEMNDAKETAKKGASNGDALAQLQADLEAVRKERDAFGANANEWKGRYDALDSAWKKKEMDTKRTSIIDGAMSKIKFRDDVSAITRKGFIADFFERHDVDLSGDAPKVVDRSSGAIVMDKTKAQTFASLDVLLAEVAEAAKLTTTSPQGGTAVKRTVSAMSGGSQGQQAAPGAERRGARQVMPRY